MYSSNHRLSRTQSPLTRASTVTAVKACCFVESAMFEILRKVCRRRMRSRRLRVENDGAMGGTRRFLVGISKLFPRPICGRRSVTEGKRCGVAEPVTERYVSRTKFSSATCSSHRCQTRNSSHLTCLSPQLQVLDRIQHSVGLITNGFKPLCRQADEIKQAIDGGKQHHR
jgi:hypothetical protein